MKKIMILTTLAALAAGTAFAQEGDDRGSSNDRDWNRDSGGQHNSWNQRDERNDRQGWNQDRRGWDQNRRGDEQRPGGPVDPALMQQMRDLNKAIRTLGESARAETNETAKAELVTQLKAKLGEVANLIQSGQEKRIAQAEERLASLKACGFHRRSPAAFTAQGVEPVERTCDVRDARVAKRDEMLDRDLGTLALIDGRGQQGGVGIRGHRERRNPLRLGLDQVNRG